MQRSHKWAETEANFDLSTAVLEQHPILLGTMELSGSARLRVGRDHGRRGTERSVQILH